MRKVLLELKEFTTQHGKASFFLFQFLLLSSLIYANYSLGLEEWADAHKKTFDHFLRHVAIYFIPYFGTLLGYYWLVEKSFKRISLKVVLVAVFAVSIMAFNEYFYLHTTVIKESFYPYVAYLIHLCANNLVSFLTYMLPIVIYWFLKHKKQQPLYGFSMTHFSPKLYFILLGIMIPIVAIASFDSSFTAYYPRYKDYGTMEYFDLPEWLGVIVFEICYGIDFVSTEVYFRGFLVLGMLELFGPAAVFSMVSIYCVVHFGKPFGECVSSIFGGYILGVITWYTRSIYGGVIIHLGIAWLMELFAFWQK